ncbi:acetate--CoA ligase family protein [Elioraea rosea]|uniref:acetate--CoA ligase family protein n=1 Tax=Elioraea rosea TaxID=2492390 RepID=UPI0011834834|nr:acetate--CoA ligase family protein [Elioraea rosea]
MRFASLTPLLAPRSIAILGASQDPIRIGGRPIAYMKERGFAGPILPVNPNRDRVQGLRAYPTLADVPGEVDAAIIAVPGAAAEQAVADCIAKGVKAAIMFTAGFAEVDEAGAAVQARFTAAAKAAGMRLLGPNALGLFNARLGYYPIFSSSFENGWPHPGRIGIASQSGAYGTHLFALARDRRLGTPILVTTGNEADVTLGEAIGWLAEDPETDVIVAYSEGVRDAPSFLAAIETARRAQKPVAMIKVGRSALGARAARSHTASIAGDDAVTDAVLRDAGVFRARNTEELLDVAEVSTRRIYPVGNTLGVVTISGGAGVLISDAAEAVGLAMPPMPEEAQARLKALVPFSSSVNPVDCTAQAFNDMSVIGRFAESMLGDGGYTSAIAFFTQVGASRSIAPSLRKQLDATVAKFPDRLFILSVTGPDETIRAWQDGGYLVFEDPTRAVGALAAMGRFGEAFARPAASAPMLANPPDLPAASPDEAEAKRILAAIGIASPEEVLCASAEAAAAAADRLGFPVAMKLVSPDVLHKSEIGGVKLGLEDAESVRSAHDEIVANAARHAPEARVAGVLVTPMVSGGVECVIGVTRDPVFGPVAMVGLGGVFVEVLRDVCLRLCPFGEAEALAMIRSLRGFPLLHGARGRPRMDVAALAAALSRLSCFAASAGPRLAGVEVNPLMVLPEGRGALALDAVLTLED